MSEQAVKTTGQPRSQAETSPTGWPEALKKVFPQLENWPEGVIAENLRLLIEAFSHNMGKCAEVQPLYSDRPTVHTYQRPLAEPGRFEETECPASWRRAVQELTVELPRRFLSLRLEELDYKDKVADFVARWPEKKARGEGLLIAGPVGTGKTQLAVSLAVELAQKYLIRPQFITFSELLQTFKEALNSGVKKLTLTSLLEADLLILDDLGTARLSDFDVDRVTDFIDHIYRNMAPVLVVTTNLSKAELKEYLGERTASRLMEMCEPIIFKGPDRRQRK
ncbi:MAG: ATP-binding protein [Moorellaceae bacterium]